MVRILLVDDHELFRAGIRSILDQKSDYDVVAEAGNGEEAIDLCEKKKPEVVLMDVNMPGIGGIEATRRITHQYPDIHVIAVTALSDDPFPEQLLDAGAKGYLSKGCPAEEMFAAIKNVCEGKHYLSSEVAKKLSLSRFNSSDETSSLKLLSPREMQVMRMIAQGQNNQEISDTLFLSPKTISTYRHRLFEKLDVNNDVELTRYAIKHGVIDA